MLAQLFAFAASLLVGFATVLWLVRRREVQTPARGTSHSRSAPGLRVPASDGLGGGGEVVASTSAVPSSVAAEDREASSTEDSESNPTRSLLKKVRSRVCCVR